MAEMTQLNDFFDIVNQKAVAIELCCWKTLNSLLKKSLLKCFVLKSPFQPTVPESGDIWICTYPKCGTTWTQNIVYLLLNDGQPLPDKKRVLSELCPFVEAEGTV